MTGVGLFSSDFSVRRRAERVFSFDTRTLCTLECPAISPEGLKVLDISELGAKISIRGRRNEIPHRELVTGRLVLGESFCCTVRMRLVYTTAETAGVEFVHTPRQVSHLICNFFRHELLGATLRPMKNAGREEILRFSDDGPNWLELTLHQKELETFSADLLSIGIHLKWSRQAGRVSVLPGFFKESPRNLGVRDLLRIIRNIPGLDSDLKSQLESAILKDHS